VKVVEFSKLPHTVLAEKEDFGINAYILAPPTERLWADSHEKAPKVRHGVDTYDARIIQPPSALYAGIHEDDNWQAMSRRSLARFHALTLLAEDPQRRFDARPVSTLAHQMSLVRHILDNRELKRVLIADEVGLGKTIEAGLILKEFIEAQAGLRILYLAPARLVSNVASEFQKMEIGFRMWKSGDSDANLEMDNRIIASIHRAVHPNHYDKFTKCKPWDILVVDECHHLSDWAPGGGNPVEKFRLVRDIVTASDWNGYLLMLSGTPHQAHQDRFENLLGLLKRKEEPKTKISGRVIYRTKEDVRDWDGNPLFPKRQVNPPLIVDLSENHREWLDAIFQYFAPNAGPCANQKDRALNWRCAQALQWASSSPNAGLGYLVRQAIRAGWKLSKTPMKEAVAALRPYRNGPLNEPVERLYDRIQREINQQTNASDLDDLEDIEGQAGDSDSELGELMSTGVDLVNSPRQPKWEKLWNEVIKPAGDEKIVLFAQPIETVMVLAQWLKKKTGQQPALIIGGQTDAERADQVTSFRSHQGPQFLVSSKAGGEGINLQIARRLVHIDVPWNPMDMEQRIGRVHRFGSKETIIVDTLVVSDTREERMWKVARSKLRSVAQTMVEPEKFEALFSRVMSLVAPEEIQEIFVGDPTGNVSEEDSEKLSTLVVAGFERWQQFDKRFSKTQREIKQMNAGLTEWQDVGWFLKEYGGAEDESGISITRFRFDQNNLIVSSNEPADILRFRDGSLGYLGNLEGAPLDGPRAQKVSGIGLNESRVLEVIRQHVLVDLPTGAANLRWGVNSLNMINLLGKDACVLAFFLQKIQFDTFGGSKCLSNELVIYGGAFGSEQISVIEGKDKRSLISALQKVTVRSRPLTGLDSDWITRKEKELGEALFKPSPEQLKQKIRIAVWPILSAHITI
jgi:superfamily II DNA or RNA helicase